MGCTTSKSGKTLGGNNHGAGSDKITFMERDPREDYKFGEILSEETYVNKINLLTKI